MSVKDNTSQVLDRLQDAVKVAAEAVKIAATEAVVKQMETGYHTPHKTYNLAGEWTGEYHTNIRHTGDLEREVQEAATVEVTDTGATVTVGNALEYALEIHEGSSRIEGRPYLRDGLQGAKDRICQVWESYIAESMKE